MTYVIEDICNSAERVLASHDEGKLVIVVGEEAYSALMRDACAYPNVRWYIRRSEDSWWLNGWQILRSPDQLGYRILMEVK